MEKPEVLIVGINSFLAKAVCKKLGHSHKITGVYHQNKSNIPKEVEVVQINEIEQLADKPFGCVFLISSYIPKDKNLAINKQIIQANLELPEKIHRLFPKARLIFCSSVSIFEKSIDSFNISLKTIPAPYSCYALSKLWGEKIIAQHQSYAILRISSMYGPGMNRETFIPKIIEAAILHKEITLWGKGERLQNYIYIEDVAEFLIRASQIKENSTLFAVGQYSYSNVEIAKKILSRISGKLKFKGIDQSKSFQYDNDETIRTLGAMDYKKIDNGLMDTIQWIKKQY